MEGLLTVNTRCMNARPHERFTGTTINGDIGSADGRKHSNGIFSDPVKWSIAMDSRNLLRYEIKAAVRRNHEVERITLVLTPKRVN